MPVTTTRRAGGAMAIEAGSSTPHSPPLPGRSSQRAGEGGKTRPLRPSSVRRWRKAARQAEKGARPEDELPRLHPRILELADAEDLVDCLLARGGYEPDHDELVAARRRVARLAGEVGALMGDADYTAGRWAGSADLPGVAPANPDDLR